VIDDDPDCREVFQRPLEALGLRVAVAADGVEGLEQSERWYPDAVFCDVAMPGMDGLEFATRMRADGRFRGVPLVAVTGVPGQPVLMATWIAGFDGHIDKPMTAAAWGSLTKRFVGRRQAPATNGQARSTAWESNRKGSEPAGLA
jgi:CheY-like chemotaxis protein